MTNCRTLLVSAAFFAISLIAPPCAAFAADQCPPSAGRAALSELLDRYVIAVNSHDTGSFATIFTDGYIQHSGRSPSGLAAQIANLQHIVETWPDIQMRVEDRIIDDDKIAARVTFTATHSRTVLGVAPTGRKISFVTMDIWRTEGGKLAEHWDLVDTVGLQKQLRGE
jgi:predicted ester cyclase